MDGFEPIVSVSWHRGIRFQIRGLYLTNAIFSQIGIRFDNENILVIYLKFQDFGIISRV
jgi:hypothetical protein